MQVLKAPTYYRKKKIEDLTSGKNHQIKFITDKNGNYIVSQNILKDPAFNYLKSEFQYLELIEYQPKASPEL